MHEVWDFGSDVITREVHSASRVYQGAGVMRKFSSNYLSESGRRVTILDQIYINGSVEYLSIPDFHRTGGPFQYDNLLDTLSSWGDGGTTTNKKLLIQLGGPYVSVSIPWCGAIAAHSDYVSRSLENARAAARCCAPRP